MPPNGLVVYTGTVATDDGKEKKLNIDFEPFKPINTSLYLCDNKFHTEALNELLESDNKCAGKLLPGAAAKMRRAAVVAQVLLCGACVASALLLLVSTCLRVWAAGAHVQCKHVIACLHTQVRLHCDGWQRVAVWDALREHARGMDLRLLCVALHIELEEMSGKGG